MDDRLRLHKKAEDRNRNTDTGCDFFCIFGWYPWSDYISEVFCPIWVIDQNLQLPIIHCVETEKAPPEGGAGDVMQLYHQWSVLLISEQWELCHQESDHQEADHPAFL